MKFYLPLTILLTTLSPNLQAATVTDILPFPYEAVSPSILDAPLIPGPLDWSGSLIDFETLTPQGLENSTTGTLALTLNGSPAAVNQFIGEILPTREFTLTTTLGSSLVALDGIFTLDYSRALGRVYSLDSSEVTGVFELQAVGLPTSMILLLSAGATLMLFTKRSTR